LRCSGNAKKSAKEHLQEISGEEKTENMRSIFADGKRSAN
jgi:hypothetical protein